MKKWTEKRGLRAAALTVVFAVTHAIADGAHAQTGVSFPPKYQHGKLEIGLIGRVQQDFIWSRADTADFDISQSALRRLRAGVQGKYGPTIKYKIELNFDASGDVTVSDAYVSWRARGARSGVIAGHFKTPNSLDNLTSSRFGSTLERAAFVGAFGFDRRVGAEVFSNGRIYTLTAAVFGETLEQDPLQGSFAFAGRATYNPVMANDVLVHLGASLRYREQSAKGGLIRYGQRPYANISGAIIGSAAIASSDFFAGIEAAAIFKNFWAAGEYGRLSVDCVVCAANPGFDGYYLEAGVFLGGRRSYRLGKFDRPAVDRTIVKGGLGALALIARYDSINLAGSAIDAGALKTLILGAEWWPSAHAKLSVNYFNADAALDDTAFGLDPAFAAFVSAGATRDGVEGAILRLQLDL